MMQREQKCRHVALGFRKKGRGRVRWREGGNVFIMQQLQCTVDPPSSDTYISKQGKSVFLQ